MQHEILNTKQVSNPVFLNLDAPLVPAAEAVAGGSIG